MGAARSGRQTRVPFAPARRPLPFSERHRRMGAIMSSRLSDILTAAFLTAEDAGETTGQATAQVLSEREAIADTHKEDAQSRVDRQFIELLARGVIQFAPDSSQGAEKLECTRSQFRLSKIDLARIRARSIAIDFEDAGDSVTAEAIRKAIKPERRRGRPPEWQPSDVLSLWMDVLDLARRRRNLRGRSIFNELANRQEWQEFTLEMLRSKFREGARKIGMGTTDAIAALRALGP